MNNPEINVAFNQIWEKYVRERLIVNNHFVFWFLSFFQNFQIPHIILNETKIRIICAYVDFQQQLINNQQQIINNLGNENENLREQVNRLLFKISIH